MVVNGEQENYTKDPDLYRVFTHRGVLDTGVLERTDDLDGFWTQNRTIKLSGQCYVDRGR